VAGDPPKKRLSLGIPLAVPEDEARHVRTTSAPPAGSELALEKAAFEARQRAYPRAGTPIGLEIVDVRTPVEKIEERSKRAADFSESAASGVQQIRDEFGQRIGAVEVTVANMDGKLDVLLTTLPAALNAGTLTLTTKLEVEKAKELDVVDGRKAKREISKVVVGGLVTAVVSLVGAVVYLLTH